MNSSQEQTTGISRRSVLAAGTPTAAVAYQSVTELLESAHAGPRAFVYALPSGRTGRARAN
ncbi:hypothetical protein [Streptomyces shenzhenensis]|uniref:hypothetical protein n=1 Tax=Streptomyces shenzhenensis TaxID=943815 RepID=UPI001F347E31|nr:hypothetical protein [Streptomyces shenzhenensis]